MHFQYKLILSWFCSSILKYVLQGGGVSGRLACGFAWGGPQVKPQWQSSPSVRSRASPYEKRQEQNFLCASTTKFCSCLFSHCSLLTWTLSHTDKLLSIVFFLKYMDFCPLLLIFAIHIFFSKHKYLCKTICTADSNASC